MSAHTTEPKVAVGSSTCRRVRGRKIWIDMDNSPHVPFFVPIIEQLRARDYQLLLTGRDNSQVMELVSYFGLEVQLFGRHFGKNTIAKILGTGARAVQLASLIQKEKPDLAISHGSRSQLVLTSLLGIPAVTIFDYEFVNQGFLNIRPKWIIVPEAVPIDAMRCDPAHIRTYPGIKEDVYVPQFRPDAGIRQQLGIAPDEILVTMRPPATDAHYHNPLSDELFDHVVDFLSQIAGVRMVVLPRYASQAGFLREKWPALFANGKMLIPAHVVNGLNLIWFSDLVISGGGTMNREAAALGVPVYSIFRGRTGAVDRSLVAEGRLVLLENVGEVQSKVRVERRRISPEPSQRARPALHALVEHIESILESECHQASPNTVQ